MAKTLTLMANRLLQALPPGEAEKLTSRSEVLDMPVRHTVFVPGQPSKYVYVPLFGVVSVHTRMREGMAVEIATIGREGIVGLESAACEWYAVIAREYDRLIGPSS